MPPEGDRHMMIYSQGNLEPPQPEPPSRSPSPDLPPNFVPKPPVESSNFPAANNIISLLNRMSGGASLRDLIVVPAATWDRNNTMWEHKMAQLRKKHRKDWAEKEVELRRKYDEQYSDARYREMLLAKEMKEMDFARAVSGGEVLGKTWKEHKAAKRDMEKTYTERIQEIEKKLAASECTVGELRKALAEKETAIDALQNAIGRQTPPEKPQPPQQPQQLQPIQQYQQLENPQYQIPQMNSNMVVAQGPSHAPAPHGFFPPSLQDFQHALQQYQQQPPQVVDHSMAIVRAGAFGDNSATIVNPFIRHQDSQYSQPVENRQRDHGGSRGHDLRNSQGNDRYQNTTNHTPSSNQRQNGPGNSHFANSPGGVAGDRGYQHPYPTEPQTVASWNNVFYTPQNRSIATKELPLLSASPPPPPSLPLLPLQPNIRSTTSRPSPFISVKPSPTFGFKGPFGPQSQTVAPIKAAPVKAAPIPTVPIPFGRLPENFRSVFGTTHEPVSLREDVTKDAPFRTSAQIDSPEIRIEEDIEDPPGVPKATGISKAPRRHTTDSARQKRRHSASPPAIPRVTQKAKKSRQGEGPPQAKGPSLEGVTMAQEEIDKAIEDVTAEYSKIVAAVIDEELISEVDLTNEEENVAAKLIDDASNSQRIVCVKLKEGMAWSGPEYIINKIRGGILESVHVYDKDREVFASFINPTAAQKFYDFFNQNPDAKEAFIRFKIFVRWVSDAICPISPDLAEVVANGATRCLKVFQIPNDKLVDDIKAEFGRDRAPFSVLSVHLSTEKSRRKDNGGMGTVAKIEFFSIMLALETKEKIQTGDMSGYLNCDVEFADDPCEKRDGKLHTMDSMRNW